MKTKEYEDTHSHEDRLLIRLIREDDGVGVIEIVLILVVLIGLVTVFRREINSLLEKIFSSITSLSDDLL